LAFFPFLCHDIEPIVLNPFLFLKKLYEKSYTATSFFHLTKFPHRFYSLQEVDVKKVGGFVKNQQEQAKLDRAILKVQEFIADFFWGKIGNLRFGWLIQVITIFTIGYLIWYLIFDLLLPPIHPIFNQ
jgi:hypothetical protein